MKIAVLNIATGPYIDLFPRSMECIENNFFTSEDVDLFLFTDSDEVYESDRVNIKKYVIKRSGWPKDTLYRYHYFLLAEEDLVNYDYVFYIDVDMNVIAPVGQEVLGELVATYHPGFYNRPGATFENRKMSTAYVEPQNRPYFAGGFQGGVSSKFLDACRAISKNVDIDESNGITAVWHDESHWNAYLCKETPTLSLSPAYCYPEDDYPWLAGFKGREKIVVIEKDEKALREGS